MILYMNQCIQLTNWFFFLTICLGSCPHSRRLGCPRPPILLLSRFLNIIINKHSKHLLHLLGLTPITTFTHILTLSFKTLVFFCSLMLFVRKLNNTCTQYVKVKLRCFDSSTSPCSSFQFCSASSFSAMYSGLPVCMTLCTIVKVWYTTIFMIDMLPVLSRRFLAGVPFLMPVSNLFKELWITCNLLQSSDVILPSLDLLCNFAGH